VTELPDGVPNGLWSDGLAKRVRDEAWTPRCVGCGSTAETTPPHELTLLWRRSKRFRRHRVL
jgi:hypothetical protein